MTPEYPEWLVDRVAKAMAETFFDDDEFGWDNMSQAAIALWRRDAGRVLDALGFQERTARGILINGEYVGYASPYLQRDTIKTYSHWTARTEWHEVEGS